MIERQKNGKFRVHLNQDERVQVSDIESRELAEAFDRVLQEAYHRGTMTPTQRPPWHSGDDDD
jgi:hypothetical protein